MKFKGDIDIDLGNREELLQHIKHIPAAMRNVSPIRKHSTGVHVTEIPYDPEYDMSSIDYATSEERGYFKLDLLNVHVYAQVKNEEHLVRLMKEPNWNRLNDADFVSKVIHIGNHYHSIKRMPEPIDSIPRLAMFLALIRPGKKHLVGLPWKEVAKTVWDKDDQGYQFKRSHSVGYAHLVVVHMNLIEENELFTASF
jgi:hypothetical protein